VSGPSSVAAPLEDRHADRGPGSNARWAWRKPDVRPRDNLLIGIGVALYQASGQRRSWSLAGWTGGVSTAGKVFGCLQVTSARTLC
jgi:hypothetical protein